VPEVHRCAGRDHSDVHRRTHPIQAAPGKLKAIARALYGKGPDVATLAGIGLLPSDYGTGEDDTVDVWPENKPALDIFWRMSTQWRVGGGGPYGLDYGPMFTLMERRRLSPEEWDALLDDIQILEAEAIALMAEERESKTGGK
jgi:hypothetical protein